MIILPDPDIFRHSELIIIKIETFLQVHLGLTPSKLIVASDILTPAEISNIYFPKDADPEIESFELLSVFPIECLNLSIFSRKRRRVLKARFCNDRVLYFELGGNKTR